MSLSRFLRKRLGTGAVYVNLDMVGRLEDKPLRVAIDSDVEERRSKKNSFTAASLRSLVTRTTKAANVTAEFWSVHSAPSDHLPFLGQGFAVISMTTGKHADYHRPTDTLERLDLEGLERIFAVVHRIVEETAR